MFLLKSKKYFVIAILCLAEMVVGCSVIAPPRVNLAYEKGVGGAAWPDGGLKRRFEAYWHYRFSGNVPKEFRIESPDFQEMVPFGRYENYVKHAAENKLVKMEIQKITNESEYLVRVDCVADIQPAGGGKLVQVSLSDRWVLVKGQWYHVTHDPLIYYS